jgi:hypothetical protein
MKMHLLENEKNIKKNVIFIIAQVTEFNATFCIDRAFEKKTFYVLVSFLLHSALT